MENAKKFREKIRRGETCLGVGIAFADATATEALCSIYDSVWIDAEHKPFSLETVQAHVMATRGTDTVPLVRVAWNDPVIIKPVLDIGVGGIIVPMVKTAEEARQAVAACRYPPEGIRGYGPRRLYHYPSMTQQEFVKFANEEIIVIVQIEHFEAVNDLEEILAVPGLTGVVVGPNDLSGSMGMLGQTRHPDVLKAIETVIAKARKTDVFCGIAIGHDPDIVVEWFNKGMQWVNAGEDISLMMGAAEESAGAVRARLAAAGSGE